VAAVTIDGCIAQAAGVGVASFAANFWIGVRVA